MKHIVKDLQYALRQARRAPVFALATAAVLAVGIGSATAIYSVVDHILLRPLDLPESERVVTLCETHGAELGHCSVSTVNLSDWTDAATTFEALGAARGWSMALRTGEGARFVASGIAMPGFFSALGVAPSRGRLLVEEDLPGAAGGAAVVAHEFWQTELNGREDVIGSTLLLDDVPRTVVGVLPEGFRAPRLEWIRVWLPLHFHPRDEERRDWRGFVGIGRLAPGVTLEQAEAEVDQLQAALGEAHESVRGWGVTVTRVRDHIVAPVQPVLRVFLAAVAVLLVIVSVNVANLLLARATARERELAVRLALGAGHAGITRLLLVEAGALALLGCLGGVAMAYAGTELFVALAPAGIPRLEEVSVDSRVLAFAAGVSALAALVFGLAPASRAWALDLASSFRDARSGGGTRRTVRLRRGLVVVQLGLALALVFGAGLLARSFSSLLRWEPGFEVERLLTFSVFLSPGTYPTTEDVRRFLDRAESELAARPGVESVGTVSAGPLFGGGDGRTPFQVEGRPPVPLSDAPTVAWFDAGPGYLATLGLPVLDGRNLDPRDGPDAPPVALVNRTMATRHWSNGSPVGARLQLPELETAVEIVGVIPDVPPFEPGTTAEPELYFSNRQFTRWGTFFVLRTRGEPAAVVPSVEAVLSGVDPDVIPSSLATMRDHVAGRLVRPRFNLALVGILAAVALILGAAGTFAVVAYMVALRRHEIGVRIALGADRAALVRWVVADGLRLLAGGLALGLFASFLFTQLLSGLLVGVGRHDPVAVIGTVLALATVVIAASLPPALRAAGVAPAAALRAE